jgi:hypothetical protein
MMKVCQVFGFVEGGIIEPGIQTIEKDVNEIRVSVLDHMADVAYKVDQIFQLMLVEGGRKQWFFL